MGWPSRPARSRRARRPCSWRAKAWPWGCPVDRTARPRRRGTCRPIAAQRCGRPGGRRPSGPARRRRGGPDRCAGPGPCVASGREPGRSERGPAGVLSSWRSGVRRVLSGTRAAGRGTCSGVTDSTTSATAVWTRAGSWLAAAAPANRPNDPVTARAMAAGTATRRRRDRPGTAGALAGTGIPSVSSAASAALGTGAVAADAVRRVVRSACRSSCPSTGCPVSSASTARSSRARRGSTSASSSKGLTGVRLTRRAGCPGPVAARADRGAAAASPRPATSRAPRPPAPP